MPEPSQAADGGNEAEMGQDFERTADRLGRINEVVARLDGAIRAQAFEVLRPFIGAPSSPAGSAQDRRSLEKSQGDLQPDKPEGLRDFIAKQSDKKPSDNVYSLVAWMYSQYGIEPFNTTEILALAEETGLTIPARVDMTLESMKREGKKLVQKVERGTYRVTVHGEIFFKDKYQVTKGTIKRQADR